MPSVQEKEQQFHDRVFSDGTRQKLDKFYSITRASREYYERLLSACCGPRRRVLEYGCGTAGFSVPMSRLGSAVTAIDISPVAVRMTREWAFGKGARSITFCNMNAETLAFGDAAFDLVCGTGILHHLDLDKSVSELARVLKPDGKAVFIEPLGHNPVINLYRRLTPNMRTEDEHPLLMADLRLARKYFGAVDVRYFHLHSLLAVPFRNARLFSPLLSGLDAADRLLFALPFMGRFAWTAVMSMSDPLKR